MKKSVFISAVALFVAAVGVVIALTAYFKNKNSYLYEDDDDFLFDDPDDLEYYTSEADDLPEEEEPEDEDLDTPVQGSDE
ncbi:hypothetical protein U6B65_11960 [Oscillospiraceae bacterium MB08-C2-2]|nr:hypothetical protein U6B65_11960 [Oscillospiraceae bacterium MB08-C2-2]